MSKNNKILFLLSLWLFIALPSLGQSYEKVLEEQNALKEQMERQRQDSVNIATDILDMQTILSRIKENNELLKKELQTLRLGNSKETIENKEREVGLLKDENDSLSSNLAMLKTSIQAKRNELEKAKGYIAELGMYSKGTAKQEYEKCKALLVKPYSQLNIDTLQTMKASAVQFKSMEGFKSYERYLEFTIGNKILYDLGHELISKPYNFKTITTVGLKIRHLRMQKANAAKGVYALSKEQYKDLFELDQSLSRYTGGIKELQKIVANVNKDQAVKNLRSGKEADPKAVYGKYLEPSKANNLQYVMDRYFSRIPYLNGLFQKYKEELSSNPLAKTHVEKEIMNYKTE